MPSFSIVPPIALFWSLTNAQWALRSSIGLILLLHSESNKGGICSRLFENLPVMQSHIQRLQSAASMGGASMPMMDLTNQIYQALSGQLSGQLNLPSHTSGIPNGNPLLNLSHANSAHLPVTLSQVSRASDVSKTHPLPDSQNPGGGDLSLYLLCTLSTFLVYRKQGYHQ